MSTGKDDTLFKDRDLKKTLPYLAAQTYMAHIWEYFPLGLQIVSFAAVIRVVTQRFSPL